MPTLSQPVLALIVFFGIEIGAFFLRRANVSRRFLHASAFSVALFVGIKDSRLGHRADGADPRGDRHFLERAGALLAARRFPAAPAVGSAERAAARPGARPGPGLPAGRRDPGDHLELRLRHPADGSGGVVDGALGGPRPGPPGRAQKRLRRGRAPARRAAARRRVAADRWPGRPDHRDDLALDHPADQRRPPADRAQLEDQRTQADQFRRRPPGDRLHLPGHPALRRAAGPGQGRAAQGGPRRRHGGQRPGPPGIRA